MRFTLTIEITRGRPEPPPEREADMGSAVDLADPHPEPDRPIGFRRAEEER